MNYIWNRKSIADRLIFFTTTALAFWFSFLLRFDFHLGDANQTLFWTTLPLLILSKALFAQIFSVHRRSWRYVSLVDVIDIVKACAAGSLLFAALVLFLDGKFFPRSVYLLDLILCPMLVVGGRVIVRIARERRPDWRESHWKRVAVIGAGDAGQALVKELLARRNHECEPIVILDDNPNKQGLRIHGVPVEGPISALEDRVRRYRIEEVIVACHQLSPEKLAQIHQVCERFEIPLKRIPRFEDILNGQASPFTLQEIQVEDLLPRSGISLKTDALVDFYRGKRILVTGAGGSIGSELVRQICACNPERLILFERSEYHLYEIDKELQTTAPGLKWDAVIGDVMDSARVDHVLKMYHPQIVFHAAAYKHVPLMEANVVEAAKNNVQGTEVISSLSMKNNVESFILISTDKAVHPFNAMGYTKRVAELLLEEKFNCSKTKFMAVRFGNVLDSAGSVVPLFREQIAKGGPITVTDPEVTRYFMTIPEAVQLVMSAGCIGKGGEIFVLDMGRPVKIADLAKRMIELSGAPHVQIQYVGLRPGERMTESLVSDTERAMPTENTKIKVIYPNRRTDIMISGLVSSLIREIDESADSEVLSALKRIVSDAERTTDRDSRDNVVALPSSRQSNIIA